MYEPQQGHPAQSLMPPVGAHGPSAPNVSVGVTLARVLPWALAALFGLIGFLLAVASFLVEHSHPRSAVRHWHATLQRGDIATLRADKRLGARNWTDSLVNDLGTADYLRVLEIYERASTLGREDFNRMQQAARNNGQAAFEALSREQQRFVTTRSHVEWVFKNGAARVTDDDVLGSWEALLVPATPAMLQTLGTLALSPDEQALLANRATTDPAVVADSMLAELAARRDREGQRIFAAIGDRVYREGDRQFRDLPGSERYAIDGKSRADFYLQQGFARMTESDRTRLGNAEALLDDSGSVAGRLGLERLELWERAEIEGTTRADFEANRDEFVESNGVRLARALLIRNFGASKYVTETVRIRGRGTRDLIRRKSASVTLAWPAIGADQDALPVELTMDWSADNRDWRIVSVRWRPKSEDSNDGDRASTETPTAPSDVEQGEEP